MIRATFHLHGALNDFLPPWKKDQPLSLVFNPDQSVKHLVESLGVPHTEIGAVLVDGSPVNFDYLVRAGELVEIDPIEDEVGAGRSIAEFHFVVDNHLGRLACYLRMLGFDTLYRNDFADAELAHIAEEQGRILLTRDRRLLMRKQVQRGCCLRSLMPQQQLLEVVRRYHLRGHFVPFRRCMRCNGILQPVTKKAVLNRLEPLTRKYFDEFRICPDCQQVYWNGSHYQQMRRLIQDLEENGVDQPQ
jgi:hypothetical protein